MHAVVRRSIQVLVALLVLGFVLAFVAWVWPTPYRYDHLTTDGSTYPVRINRWNGDADMLVPDEGWVPVEGETGAPDQQNATAVAAR